MRTAESIIVYLILAPLAIALLILEKIFGIKFDVTHWESGDPE